MKHQYHMDLLGTDDRGRIRWRGTGFNPDPGGLTWITEKDLRGAMRLFQKWLKERDPPIVRFGPVLH